MKINIDTKNNLGMMLRQPIADQVEKILARKWRFNEDLNGAECFHELMSVIGPEVDKAGGKALDAIECTLRLTEVFSERMGGLTRSEALQPDQGAQGEVGHKGFVGPQGEKVHTAAVGEDPRPQGHFEPDPPIDIAELMRNLGDRVAADMAGKYQGRIAAVFVLEERPEPAAPEPAPDPVAIDPFLLGRNLENDQLRANIELVKARISVEEAIAAEIRARTPGQ